MPSPQSTPSQSTLGEADGTPAIVIVRWLAKATDFTRAVSVWRVPDARVFAAAIVEAEAQLRRGQLR